MRYLNPRNILAFLLQEERRGSVLLVVVAAAALVIANSSHADAYAALLGRRFTLGAVTLSIQHWINDAFMALFFLMVGLEIKRELIDGELQTLRRALFPLITAAGGMLVPALLFSALNPYLPKSDGWAIPMATDIAIAVSLLGLLGKRVPRSLRVFLLSLAIVDDIGSIAIIALFYNQPTNMFALLIAAVLSLSLLWLRKQKYWPLGFAVVGAAILYCLLLAGVSGTMAGVVIAWAMPLRARRARSATLQSSEKFEDVLIPFVSFGVIPLFVIANAGLKFADISFASDGGFSVFLGVVVGLCLGKPIGIVASGWLATVLRVAHKPRGVHWGHLVGIGFLAGVGFTVSLFVSGLAYGNYYSLRRAAIVGIFVASIVSAIIGLLILQKVTSRQKSKLGLVK